MLTVDCAGPLPSGITRAAVRALVARTCRRSGHRGGGSVAVRVTGDADIRRLNRTHRGKDKVTDVLSFSYAGVQLGARSSKLGALNGDLIISLPQVRRQAKAIGRSTKAEFALMIVHGTLHLLGHDHESVPDESRMFALQHDILIRAGYL